MRNNSEMELVEIFVTRPDPTGDLILRTTTSFSALTLLVASFYP